LTWYEGSASFGNNTLDTKKAFNFEPGSYTFSWLWCTTDKGFNRYWPKLAGMASGLVDRMFFVVSPEEPNPTAPFYNPDFSSGANRTRELMARAVSQQHYEFEDFKGYADKVSGMDARSMELVRKLALFFAVDLGLSAVDADCVERAVALLEYRNQATRFLDPIEADNQQGRLQKEIIRELRQNRGKMRYRDLCRELDYTRYGLDVWKRAYSTMLPEGIICEFKEKQASGQTSKMVGLLSLD
jgi:hypothetical protein